MRRWLIVWIIALVGCGGSIVEVESGTDDAGMRRAEGGKEDAHDGATTPSADSTDVVASNDADDAHDSDDAATDSRVDRVVDVALEPRDDNGSAFDGRADTSGTGDARFDSDAQLEDRNRDDIVADVVEESYDVSVSDDVSVGNDAPLGDASEGGDAPRDLAVDGVPIDDGAIDTGCTPVTCNLVSLLVTPSGPSISPHGTQWLKAIGVYVDSSTRDLTKDVHWLTSQPLTAYVSQASGTEGLVTGVTTGSATITAEIATLSATAMVTVLTSDPVALRIVPPWASIPGGTALPLTAVVSFSDGSTEQDLTEVVTWSSSAPAVGAVSAGGVLSGVGHGQTTITASLYWLSASADVTVTATTLIGLSVSPATMDLPSGFSQPLRALGLFADGSTRDVTSLATWGSSDPTHVTVSDAAGSKGKINGAALGGANVSASFGGMMASSSITVTNATLWGIAILYPPSGRLMLTMELDMRAEGYFSDGGSFEITDITTWSSRSPAIIAVSGKRVAARAEGATILDAQAAGVQSSLSIEVLCGALETISISPNPIDVVAGYGTYANAQGNYNGGLTYDLTWFAIWDTVDRGVAWFGHRPPGAPAQLMGRSPGTTTVRASWGGASGTSTVNVASMSPRLAR